MSIQELKDLLDDVADHALTPAKAFALLEDEMEAKYGSGIVRLDLTTEDGE